MPPSQVSPASPLPGPPPEFACLTRVAGPGVSHVILSGELDLAAVPQLEDALTEAARGSVTVILDLSQITFMDSSGLHTILRAHARLEEADRRLLLIPGCRQVQRIFEITGIDDHLEFVNASDKERLEFPRPA